MTMTWTLNVADLAKGDLVPEFSGHVLSITESRRPGTGELGGYLIEVSELTGGTSSWLVPVDHVTVAVLGGSDYTP